MSNEYISLKKTVSGYVNKYPALNKNTNKVLLEELYDIKSKDPLYDTNQKYIDIRENLILSNGGFAMKYATLYTNVLNDPSILDEMFQEAIIGIIETIDKFDITRKNSFTTYAFYHIRKRIIDWIKHSKLIRAPRDIARNMKHVNEVLDILLSEKEINFPTYTDVKNELCSKKNISLKPALIEDIMVLLMLNSAEENESFITEYTDHVIENEEFLLFKEMSRNILESLKDHSEDFKNVIINRFGIDQSYTHTLSEIKLMFNLTDNDLKELEKEII